MSDNIIELYRQRAVEKLFQTDGFSKVWPCWKNTINQLVNNQTVDEYFNLGDHLAEIFASTKDGKGRTQSSLSGGGANWEALVCWYLNLCLIGHRTVVIKHHKKLIPDPISKSITVNYGNFPSNTESDLIAITFPVKVDYTKSIEDIKVYQSERNLVPIYVGKNKKLNFDGLIEQLIKRDFAEIEVYIIQCKTNWNDNAQIPMLWDAVYSAESFSNGITIGSDGFSIRGLKRFKYCFVTVPTNKLTMYGENKVSVLRVKNLSGGNYWGHKTQRNIAASVKEMFTRVFLTDINVNIRDTLTKAIPHLVDKYSYFNIT